MAQAILVNFQAKAPGGQVMGGSVIVAAVDEGDAYLYGRHILASMVPPLYKDHVEVVTVCRIPEQEILTDVRGKRFMMVVNMIELDNKVEGAGI